MQKQKLDRLNVDQNDLKAIDMESVRTESAASLNPAFILKKEQKSARKKEVTLDDQDEVALIGLNNFINTQLLHRDQLNSISQETGSFTGEKLQLISHRTDKSKVKEASQEHLVTDQQSEKSGSHEQLWAGQHESASIV